MEDALKLELIGLGTRFFNGMKNYWTPQDLAEIYSLYTYFDYFCFRISN
jgi:hypothetical protein